MRVVDHDKGSGPSGPVGYANAGLASALGWPGPQALGLRPLHQIVSIQRSGGRELAWSAKLGS